MNEELKIAPDNSKPCIRYSYCFLCLIYPAWLKTWQRFPFPQRPGAERKSVIREQLTLLETEENLKTIIL